jgi:hypothetical protein
MRYKKRPKNKQELPAKSGVKNKPVFRDRIIFEFEVNTEVFRNGNEGRLKLDNKGYFTFVIKREGKWQNVKGKLRKLKLIKEKVVGRT